MTEESERSCIGSESRPNWPGIKVHHLILDAGDFIVWLDCELDVDWQTSKKYDEVGPKNQSEHNEILNLAAALECVPNDHHERNVRVNFKRMIGEGVARSLDHDYDSAKRILEQARLYIAERNVEKARYWQLCTACMLGLVLLFSGAVLWALRGYLISNWSESEYFLVMAGVAGSLGAVLSMIFRMGHTYPTSEAPKALHILEAMSKVLAGYLSGLLMAGCVKIGLILPVFADAGKLYPAMLVAATASGTSERWVPSLIARLERDSIKGTARKGKTQ